MPAYVYACPACKHEFDVVKRVADLDNIEHCPMCKTDCDGRSRLIQASYVDSSAGDWNRQEYNPGLGCVTFGKKDRDKKAKARGLIEVGNEKVETVHKHFDKQREDARARRWADADRVKVYED